MNAASANSTDKDYLRIAVDIAIRLAVIFAFVFGCIKIFSPFLTPVIWGAIIAIALFPLFQKLVASLGGRTKLAGAVFVLVTLTMVLVPTVLLTDSLLDGTVRIAKTVKAGTLEVPPPTEQVKSWPVIGEQAYQWWSAAHHNFKGTMEKLQPQLGKLGEFILQSVNGLGVALIQSLFALLIAGILSVQAEKVGKSLKVLGRRLGGSNGEQMIDTTADTIRSVVKGVILVALIQGLMAAAGLAIASVPAVGLWALLVTVVAVIQLPPILILGPIAVWVFANNDSTAMAVFFLVWSLVINFTDGFLKPLLLGRGVQVPMLVILIGAIGGMLQGGVVGLFIGPVILSIGYQLLNMWVAEATEEEQPAGAS